MRCIAGAKVCGAMWQAISEQVLRSHPRGLAGMYDSVLDFFPRHCAKLRQVTGGGGGAAGKRSVARFPCIDLSLSSVRVVKICSRCEGLQSSSILNITEGL